MQIFKNICWSILEYSAYTTCPIILIRPTSNLHQHDTLDESYQNLKSTKYILTWNLIHSEWIRTVCSKVSLFLCRTVTLNPSEKRNLSVLNMVPLFGSMTHDDRSMARFKAMTKYLLSWHWCYWLSCGFKGPSLGLFVFVFMRFSGKIGQIVGWRSLFPKLSPPICKIPDPPLDTVLWPQFFLKVYF